MATKAKWYVVWAGIEPGVYTSWEECKQMVDGFAGAKYKSFDDRSEAMRAYEDGCDTYYRRHYGSGDTSVQVSARPIDNALAVDAACSGNPGVMEYRGVMVHSLQEAFHVGPFPKGTNNIGEFLAIVHGLSLLKKHGLTIPIYSDSVTAISWVKKKRCKTLLARDNETAALLDLVLRAEQWLQTNTYTTPILKWDTINWGEIPADFGRKG